MRIEPFAAGNRLYDDQAWLWPILSGPAHYCHEAEAFREAIRGHATIPTTTLPDLGYGGGHNDLHLKRDFQVTGVDLSAGFLGHARQLTPEATTSRVSCGRCAWGHPLTRSLLPTRSTTC